MYFLNNTKFNIFPTIDVNTSINLRSFKAKDSREYFNYMNLEIMQNYITSDNIPSTMQDCDTEILYWQNLFTKKIGIYWAIVLKESDQIIGSVGFNCISFIYKSAEISYDLNPRFWNQGIMKQSIMKIQEYTTWNLELEEITAKVVCFNHSSIQLLNKLGFKKSAIIRNNIFLKNKYWDCIIFKKNLLNKPI